MEEEQVGPVWQSILVWSDQISSRFAGADVNRRKEGGVGQKAHFKHLSARVQHSLFLLLLLLSPPSRLGPSGGARMLAHITRDTLGALCDKGPCPPPLPPRA